MRRNKRRDTRAEALVRSELHRLGLRFRKDFPLRVEGRLVRPDVVFTRSKLAVFVDGCFWHSCPVHGTQPRANSDYWGPKLALNVRRDGEVDAALIAAEWRILRFWEHECPAASAERIAEVLGGNAGQPTPLTSQSGTRP